MKKSGFLIELTKAEKRALRILAAYGDVSMGEFIRREAIHQLWEERFPDERLGNLPDPQPDAEETDEDDE